MHMRASALWLQIPLGLGMAASVQVGNALGAGDVETAKRSSSTSLLCTGQAARVPGSLCRGSFQAQQEQGAFAVLCPRHTPVSPALSLWLLPSSPSRPGQAQHFALFFRGFLHSCGGRFSCHEGHAGIHLHSRQVSATGSRPHCAEVGSQKRSLALLCPQGDR